MRRPPNMRRHWIGGAGAIAIIAGLMLACVPNLAYAVQKQNCEGDGLLARIVPCITKTMESSTTELTNALSEFLWPATVAFIAFAIVIYGVRIMTPEGNMPKTAVPLLLKIVFVVFFVHNFGGFIPTVHGAMHESIDIIADALPEPEEGQCPNATNNQGLASDKIWVSMDCILSKLYGFTTDGGGDNAMLIASIFGLMAGFLFGGSFGLIAFLGVVGVLWSVFLFVFRSAYSFLNGFLVASFMVIISPLFIPLILFQITGQYFQSWLRVFMGAFILPIVVVGYCVFALSIYNEILFNDDSAYSIRKVMDKDFSTSITGMRTECLGSLLNSVLFRQFEGTAGGGDINNVLNSNSVQDMAIPQQSGAQRLCIKVPNIDIQDFSDKFKNKQDFFRQIFTDAAALILLAWLLAAAYHPILEFASIAGTSVAGALMGPVSSMEKRLQLMWDQAKHQAQQSLLKPDGSDYSGMQFLERVPIMVREALQGGIKGTQG